LCFQTHGKTFILEAEKKNLEVEGQIQNKVGGRIKNIAI